MVEIVAFASAFADAGEHRHAAVELGDIVNQFHDHDSLADAGATERADLSTLQEGADQIDNFDPCGKQLRRGRLVHERRRGTMDGIVLLRLDRSAFIHGVPGHIEYPAHHAFADGHGDRRAGVCDLEAALQAFGARHRNCPHPLVPKMLLHFERDFRGLALNSYIHR